MKLDVYNGTLPSLVSTTYSWTKVIQKKVCILDIYADQQNPIINIFLIIIFLRLQA